MSTFDPWAGQQQPDLIGEFVKRLIALPPVDKLAADLDEREKLAVAFAADRDLVTFEIQGHMLNMRSTTELAISDRPGGGYIVARKVKP